MRPGDNIYFFILGNIALVIFIISLIIFRKRMRIAIYILIIMAVALTSYYLYYPTIKVNTHAKDYETLKTYLADNYPDETYIVTPETLDEGAFVGQFYVSQKDYPGFGLILQVRNDEIEHFGWYQPEGPKTKDELWKQLYTMQSPTLDKPLQKVSKLDQYEDEQYIVIAATVGKQLALGVFTYSSGAISTVKMVEGPSDELIEVTVDNKTYTYIPTDYNGKILENMTRGKINSK